MLKRFRKQGFTLIELMIVVAIIGILAAIAIPNFIRFQARSKQSEPKANLKSLFTAQRSYFQEKDKYLTNIVELGFQPERGNRYAYYNITTCAAPQVRATAVASKATTQDCVEVDTFKFGSIATQPPWISGGANLPDFGVSGTCPACSYASGAAGNIDNESAGVDSWWLGSTDQAAAAAPCGNSDTAAVSGVPYNTYNDVSCDP
jgi:type IV pilus assembly protein PilA